MSPYQSQVIDATLAEFDRNRAIQEQSIRDQAVASGAFGGGREGVLQSEFGTGADREQSMHYKQVYYNKVSNKHKQLHNKILQIKWD